MGRGTMYGARSFWVLSLALAGLGGPVWGAERAPNVILIVADDLGWGDVGFNGRTEWTTPRLDRLARQGTVLNRCYAAAPICAPSRGAFLTGKYTIHSGVAKNGDDLPADQVTIAEALKPAGYTTGLFGKWHHGRPPQGQRDYVHPLDQGFDEFFGYTDATAALEKFPRELWQGRSKVPVSGYADDLFTDRALEFVDRNKAKPFFLYVAYTATHFAVSAPAEEAERFAGKLPEPDPELAVSANYAGMVTRLDHNVGRILDQLERLKLTNDTLVVFTSDNGATFEQGNQGASATLDSNRPFRGQKRTLWEGGVRVPGIVSWPGHVAAGVVSQDLTHLTDLLPTFAAVAGAAVDPAWRVDGKNLLPVWLGRKAAPERTLFWEWRAEGADQIAAMRGDFKLVVTRSGKPELFNVASDPAERRDLSAAHPELAESLKSDLDAWLSTAIK
ncbi:MAG: sulfatase-like hydrolase/transferase [Paludisphaera borealis]|uniref:sulfatase-like hydrolase/transferase n=1 Tax=Paludisphaera borealis TaxID=1387353 RepID=UPI0028431B73|nr:sulfatase-like hydrolase/transferase [Paludisphaera borealis]MDR3621353.1 sulfatase-like hydrolase/transferase [Paludisphaera borealis]